MNSDLQKSFEHTYSALKVFKEALDEPVMLKSRLNVDGTIQRFEFTFELFWKLLKRILASKGTVDVRFPKDVLQEAYAGDLIDDEKSWLSMLEDRNNTSHTYKRKLAEEIFSRIPAHYAILKKTFDQLCIKFNIDQNQLEKKSKTE
jgi:nucleotidyltransferase substrate binding protein (TIGR01987 family)